ncbi:MAG: hypothetical protein ABSE73_26390, partial [Planctomycetota bacterium]
PEYMAPEQLERPAEVDHRADIYSLGVVIYQMLTGELPPSKGELVAPSKKAVVDVRLDEVVLRALEKQPERRYQQASEVKTQVETIASTPAPKIAESQGVPAAVESAERERSFWALLMWGKEGSSMWRRGTTVVLAAFVISTVTLAIALIRKTSTEDSKPLNPVPETPVRVVNDPSPPNIVIDVAACPGGPWTVVFPGGATVELIGVGENPNDGKGWWRPDGAAVERPYDPDAFCVVFPKVRKNHLLREIAVLVNGISLDKERLNYEFDPPESIMREENRFVSQSDNKPTPPNMQVLGCQIPPDRKTIALRFAGSQDDPWQTVCDTTAPSEIKGVGGANGVAVFSQATENSGDASVTVSHNLREGALRVSAVGVDGWEHEAEGSEERSNGDTRKMHVTFSKLALKNIKAFRLERHALTWAEFRNVALQPGDTQPAVAAAKTDNIDLPFINDPQVLGEWESVDFIANPDDFDPGKRQWKGELDFQCTYQEDGKTPKPWFTWTKGVLIHHGDKTASHYDIREIQGQPYMFLEWKSGDVTIRGMKPKYYVLKKTAAGAPAPEAAKAPATAVSPPSPQPQPLHAAQGTPVREVNDPSPANIVIDVAAHPGGPWKAALPSELPGGATVELVGVGETLAKGKGWWRPDGSPAQRPYDSVFLGNNLEKTRKNCVIRDIAVELDGGGYPEREFDPPTDTYGEGFPFVQNKDVRCMRVLGRWVPAGLKTITVRLANNQEPWQTVCDTTAPSEIKGVGGANGVAIFSQATENSSDVSVSVLHNLRYGALRVAAVGVDDWRHDALDTKEIRDNYTSKMHVTFGKLALKNIKAFRLERHPCTWAEFRNVALQPGEPVAAPKMPAEERGTQKRPAGAPVPAVPKPAKGQDALLELLRVQLRQAEDAVLVAEAREKAGQITQGDVQVEKDNVEILKAQIAGDALQAARLGLASAERQLKFAKIKFDRGLIDNTEYQVAKNAVELRQVKLRLAEEAAKGNK